MFGETETWPIRIFSVLLPYLFQTEWGIYPGRILHQTEDFLQVEINILETSQNVIIHLPWTSLIQPTRKRSDPVDLNISDISPEGYLKIGCSDSASAPMSGVVGKIVPEEGSTHRIEQPFSLHHSHHQSLVNKVHQLVQSMLEKYKSGQQFQENEISLLTDQLNMLLYVDDYPSLPKRVVQEALVYFLMDQTQFPEETWIRSPLNYLFDPVRIDGICFEENGMIFLPAYQLQ